MPADTLIQSNGDFSDYFMQRWLLTYIPLFAAGVSSTILVHRNWKMPSRRPITEKPLENHIRTRSSSLEKPSALCLEAVAICLAHLLVLTSWSTDTQNGINVQGWVGELSWTYLTLLLFLRGGLMTSIPSLRARKALGIDLFHHSACLYGLHWSITAIVVRSSYLKSGELLWWTPLSLGFAVTTFLLGLALSRPLFVVAVEASPASAGGSKERKASILSLATFSWLDAIVFKGVRKRLEMQDIWKLVDSDCSPRIMNEYDRVALNQQSLLTALLLYLRRDFVLQALWASAGAILTFVPTLLMQSILRYIENAEHTTDARLAWAYLTLMLIAGIFHAVADGQATWYGQKIALRLRAIVSGKVYEKILKRAAAQPISESTESTSTTRADSGTITNLVVSDSTKIADAGSNAYELWASVPVQVTVALGLLFYVLGPSALAGVLMMLLMTPINSVILKHFGKAAMDAMGASDQRVQETDQVLRNVRMLKLFVWETWFEKKILDKRAAELKALRARLVWWSIAATIWYAVPFVITFLSFFVYIVLQHRELTPSIAFTALSLFNALKAPLDQLVGMVARIRDSLESVRRVEAFLHEPDVGQCGSAAVDESAKSITGQKQVGFRKATLGWSDATRDTILTNLDFMFVQGQLNVVAGPTGCRKTSVLLALLGEMSTTTGVVHTPSSSVAYCAQEAWLLNDTIRNNIVFASTWDDRRYQQTIEACGLANDIAILPEGESTIVGEKGIALSGGQKQRVALARAIYSSSTYVLLDDCLSAVDSHTAKWLFEKCITGPLMVGRTCILTTHRLALVLPRTAFVLVLDNGRVTASGSPKSLANNSALSELIGLEDVHVQDKAAPDSSKIHPVDPLASSEKYATQSEVASARSTISAMPERPPGHIPWAVITTYTSAMGGWLFWCLVSVFFISQQVLAIGANWWLRRLSDTYQSLNPGHRDGTPHPESMNKARSISSGATVGIWYHLGGYALILVLYTLVSFGRLYVVSIGSINASWILHKRLLASILQAKFRFFDVTTHGTLLNRFSEDIQTVDVNLVPMALGTLHFLVAMVLIVILITMLTPGFLLPGVFITMIYWTIGRLFLDSSRELKRMESEQKSPLLQQVSESLLGAATIRAFGLKEHFITSNQEKIDTVNQPLLYLGAIDRWLAFRLNVVGTLMSFLAGYFALSNIGNLSAGAVGLSLTYAIGFSENVLWLVRYHALNQQNFTAVERIRDCFQVEHEAPTEIPNAAPSDEWPSAGAVTFSGYSARYRSELPLVLNNISLQILPKQKVGIVGRTGAGKSSIANALLRSLEAESGSILLDDVDISTIGLHDLRKAITLVPQDPSLLVGSLRSNLDPVGNFTDDHILNVLHQVRLIKPAAHNNNESVGTGQLVNEDQFKDLSFQIAESSANISLGQRQLLCLARALLRSSKIVILDEATASIDYVTDLLLQQTVSELNATVITIAHRLRTIIDYDLVVVMEQGKIVQSGRPWDLMQEKGTFRNLCENSGTFQELAQLAKAAHE